MATGQHFVIAWKIQETLHDHLKIFFFLLKKQRLQTNHFRMLSMQLTFYQTVKLKDTRQKTTF